MKTTTMSLYSGLVLLCASAQAQVYDLKADFSTTSNPNGAWKFGWSEGISGAFVLFPRQHIPPVNNELEEFWDDPANSLGFTPSVARNPGGDFDDGNVTLTAGAIILHPCGVSGDAFAHVVWTAPQTGRYKVESRFFAQQNRINVDVHVLTKGVSVFDDTITENGVSRSFSQEFTLSTGDTIDFVVGPNDDFIPHAGNTGLDARITPLSGAATLDVMDGLAMRLESIDGVSTDEFGNVSEWMDLTANGHSASQNADIERRPNLVAGAMPSGAPALRFDGINDLLTIAEQVVTSQDFTIFAVVNAVPTSGGHKNLFGNWSAAEDNLFSSLFVGITAYQPDTDSAGIRFSDAIPSAGIAQQLQRHFLLDFVNDSDPAAGFATVSQDGLAIFSGGPLTTRNLTSNPDTAPYTIGVQGDPDHGISAGEYWSGDIAALLVYDRPLSPAEQSQVRQYLNDTYLELVNTPPTIRAQPAARKLFVGDSATLMVVAAGTRPLAYQWRKDSGNMSGKTNATLTLTRVTLTDSGDYTVVVTNDFGSVTSAVARVTVTATGLPTDAVVFDLRNDWSDEANPNGVWTLLAGNEVLPRLDATRLDPFSPAQGGWSGSSVPFWFKSTSEPLFVHEWQSGDIIVHTSEPGNGPANVIWSSPLTGEMEISGGVWEGRDWNDADGGFRGNHWNLYVRDILISSGTIKGGDPYSSTNPFQFSLGSGGAAALSGIQVSTNDVVRLEFVRTGTWGDYVGVNFRIMTFSEPSLTILRNADQTVSLSWRGAGALEQTASLSVPNWQRAPSQANPQSVSTTGAMKFFRVKGE